MVKLPVEVLCKGWLPLLMCVVALAVVVALFAFPPKSLIETYV